MTKFLDLPVLIILPILELLDSESLCHCALVCKSLSSFANDQLWSNVPRIDILLSMLSPLNIKSVKNETGEMMRVKASSNPIL